MNGVNCLRLGLIGVVAGAFAIANPTNLSSRNSGSVNAQQNIKPTAQVETSVKESQIKITDWITAIGTTIGASGVLLLWHQIASEHERSRRENALNHALRWTQIDEKTDLASRIAESLDDTQAKKFFDFEEISINKKSEVFLRNFFGENHTINIVNDRIKLNSYEVIKLRYHVGYWLNTLESILVAYRLSIADKDILEEEFKGCLFKGQGSSIEFILESILKEFGKNNSLPAIKQFVEKIKAEEQEREKQESKGDKKIIT